MLRGLFIGIDRYAPPINRLSCARADAVALGSLFRDNSEGDIQLLIDGDATRQAILDSLIELRSAAEGDFVVVHFSGHGTEDHRLVPVDADVDDLARTCISLDELAEHLDDIPSRQLLVILDCCFAGGFGGARVFAPSASRAPIEDRRSIERLAGGNGRVVLTASGRGEPALETARFGHGLLTYHLLEGLQGRVDPSTSDAIPLLSLFEFLTASVVASARLLSEIQTPTVYGSIEGVPALQRLTPGAAYARAFPDRVRPPASAEWSSLLPYGFSREVIDRWAALMPGLNALQLQAINNYGVLDGKSLLVVAPTSSGKTMIGEMVAVREAGASSRAVMLLPMRALVNDKYDYMRRLYGDHLAVVRATGEYADEVAAIYTGQYDLALLTYEKFLSIITASPWVLRGVSLVVVDEAQNVSDPTRGSSLEFLLTILRSGHARGGAPQVVALSAVIGDSHGLERWLYAGLLESSDRPVPLRESVIDENGTAMHLQPDGSTESEPFIQPLWGVGGQGSKEIIIPLVGRLVKEGKKVIVFRAIKGETVGTALYLAGALALPGATSTAEMLPGGDFSNASNALRQALAGGVGFHNSDLSALERVAVETSFRDPSSDLRVVVATTTLAMGVNTPAEAVVIAGLTHPGPNPAPYLVAEYKNMVGRAGRMGLADAGESYIVATGKPAPMQAWHQYVHGQPEDVTSHFLDASTDSQTMILRTVVALGGAVQRDELIDLLENSFAVWQRVDQGGPGWNRDELEYDLQALVSAELLDIEPSGHVTVTELGRYAGESGIEVRSVTQVSSLLRFANPSQPLTDADLILLAQVTVEMDRVYLPTAKRSHQEQARWPRALVMLGAQAGLTNGLHVGGGETLPRAKKAVAALRFASIAPMATIEADLMQHLRDRSASGPIRGVAARTRDVIDAVASIARVRGAALSDDERTAELGVRLELGLPAELGALAMVLGSSMTRVDYLALLDLGLTTAGQLRELDPGQLTRVVGQATADRVRSLLNNDA